MAADPSETPRRLVEALFDAREWATENGLEGALDDAKHRHVVEAAQNGLIPAEFINGRWYYRPKHRAQIAMTLARRNQRTTRQPAPASDLSTAA